ncbi:MAG: GNAT family N-acetyltransferase [Solirubrobacteraceae bacterium]
MPLETLRLTLEPLRIAHAEEMAPLLADVSLYAFTGGVPPTVEELRARYTRQAAGRSPDGVERWYNWIARRREDEAAVGFVQATVSEDPPPPTAVLAWALGVRFHGQGYAREAAAEMMRWLQSTGVTRFAAYIHPAHVASMAVARALAMEPTDALVDGEVVWEWRAGAGAAGDVSSSG